MTPAELSALGEALVPPLRRAAGEVMRIYREPPATQWKPDGSEVTAADRLSHDVLREGLARAAPGIPSLSEEDERPGAAVGRCYFLVDPLDGTRAFAQRRPGFSLMVGLVLDGRPVLGLVLDPLTEKLYAGVVGLGASLRIGDGAPAALPIRSSAAARGLRVVTSSRLKQEEVRQAVKAPLAEVFRINSVGVKAGRVLEGLHDFYWVPHSLRGWDLCAPHALMLAAGGRLTDMRGREWRYEAGSPVPRPDGCLASADGRHDEYVSLIR